MTHPTVDQSAAEWRRRQEKRQKSWLVNFVKALFPLMAIAAAFGWLSTIQARYVLALIALLLFWIAYRAEGIAQRVKETFLTGRERESRWEEDRCQIMQYQTQMRERYAPGPERDDFDSIMQEYWAKRGETWPWRSDDQASRRQADDANDVRRGQGIQPAVIPDESAPAVDDCEVEQERKDQAEQRREQEAREFLMRESERLRKEREEREGPQNEKQRGPRVCECGYPGCLGHELIDNQAIFPGVTSEAALAGSPHEIVRFLDNFRGEEHHENHDMLKLERVTFFKLRENKFVIWSDEKFLRVGIIDPHTPDRRTPQELAARYKTKSEDSG